MSLPARNKKALIASAHSLNPIVIIGNQGLTPSVLAEINTALFDHELIKVRVNAIDKPSRLSIIDAIKEKLDVHVLKIIGHIAILYKQSDKNLEKETKSKKASKKTNKKVSSNKSNKKIRRTIRK